ncbi:MAG: type II secretion system ATPase GspE [Deltaproteobacteria bacterium]|nr:type II secretion system ATPase GspE [Deltaproteobacteria bacterium]
MSAELIGEMFISKGILNADELLLGLEEQKKAGERLGATLVRLGYISKKELYDALSLQFGIPLLTDSQALAPPLLQRNPSPKFLKYYKTVPVERDGEALKVAVSDPLDPYPLAAISFYTGLKAEPVLAEEERILELIDAFYGSGPVTMEKIIQGMGDKDSERAISDTDDVEQLKDMAQEAPVINLVNILITKAVEKRASDIHIEPFEDMLHIRYRIDGILSLVESLPKRLHPAVASRVKIMSKLNIAERRLPQDGRIKLKSAGRDIDIRVSTVPTLYGESIVMRLLDPTGVISLEAIGFSEENRKSFETLIRQPHGMILVTGPTGSGKSTTLYAALSKINTVIKKVITIEDPVEYNLEGINQIQVKPKIGFTFANGLRSIVRQDPDVIMVGEIRDAETADIAIHSALTGHLILSTLHTNDAPGAVTRLIDMGIESYLISSSLLGVLAQRLVRVICENCRIDIDGYSLANIPIELKTADKELRLYKGAGCPECDNTGYKGRTVITEFMSVTDEIRELIVEKKGSNAIRSKAVEQGMVTLRDDGWAKVLKGITTADEVARVTLEQ